MRLLRTPLLHFLAVGAVLFLCKVQLATPAPSAAGPSVAAPVVISATEVARVRAAFARERGREPTAEDERELVARLVDEELLYREALSRGLDRRDRSVRYRLAEKMRFLEGESDRSDDDLHRAAIEIGLDRNDAVVRRILINKLRLLATLPTDEHEPGEAELQAYLDAHVDRYRQPARITLAHVFLSAADRGEDLECDAAETREVLVEEAAEPESAFRQGDPFPLGHRFSSKSAQDLAKIFGHAFAERVMPLEAGSWSEPIPSAFGLHLVLVEAKEPERVAPLSAVRSQVKQAVLLERRSRRSEELLDQLRSKYRVRVDAPPRGS